MGSKPKTGGRGTIYMFTHVHKAGGTTVEAVMRRRFGIRHMVVSPARGWTYRREDLVADLRLNPLARSICGHWLRPFVRFGSLDGRLAWYTMLRDPLDRFLSHYQYSVERMGARKPLREWIRNPDQHNLQTRLLAGELDSEAAKQILIERFRCVGLMERFNESLLLFRRRLGVDRLRVVYERPHNVALSKEKKERVRAEFESMRDECAEYNRFDRDLYDFVARELFPQQLTEYGTEELQRDLTTEFVSRMPSFEENAREVSNKAFRRGLYLPVLRIRSELARRRGEEATRW